MTALEGSEVKDCGVWQPGRVYGRGSMVTLKGSLWIAQDATAQTPGRSRRCRENVAAQCQARVAVVTFANLDELVDFFEQFAADKMRKFETDVILHADDFNDPIGDVIDGAREFHEEVMVEWRVNFRRELEAVPFKFPLRLTLTGFDERKRLSDAERDGR